MEETNQQHFQEKANKDAEAKKNEQAHNEALAQKEKKHLDQVKSMQEEAAATLQKRDSDHQKELRQLDSDKTRRE